MHQRPKRWYWSIVLQVRDVICQFTQGIPNCNNNPKATVFGIPKEPVLESSELITSRLTGAGSLLPPVYGEAWAKGHATETPDSTFPRYGSPHTAKMWVKKRMYVYLLTNRTTQKLAKGYFLASGLHAISSGYGYELAAGMSRVRVLELVMAHRVEVLVHIKSVEA
ncbi:hypothetical protein TNCV_3203911 [Trichonephila clavipes]|nr:hypothetical protein TNCV_3203911 [Trichonephila clavipes]